MSEGMAHTPSGGGSMAPPISAWLSVEGVTVERQSQGLADTRIVERRSVAINDQVDALLSDTSAGLNTFDLLAMIASS
jgi:hypothetical protein